VVTSLDGRDSPGRLRLLRLVAELQEEGAL